MADINLHPKEYYNRRMGSLDLEYSSFESHYKELSEFVLPRRGRFLVSDRNKGTKKHNSIINSHATWALHVCRSGMLAGTMSPSRPWFALETYDPDLMESADVKDWLHKVELILRSILNESNFYGMASQTIEELILFGTGCMTHVDDFQDVARFYNHTVGSYRIGTNDRGVVDTIYRKFEWPALRIATQFGIENVSREVKQAIERKEFDQWFSVCHVIEPNDNYRPTKSAANKAFKSVYYEPGTTGAVDREKWLNISGFDEFPAYVPRWGLTGEDIYGTDCPGMTALGDIKGLQIQEKRKAQGIDKMVNPPLAGPPSVQNVPVSSLPGGLTIYEGGDQKNLLAPLYQVNPQLQDLRLDMDAVERRIDQAFFVDMFLAITNIEGIQPRNQLDLLQRNEEKLLQLGPVLERIHGDFLDPLIDRLFNQAARAGILPPAPPDLSGQALRVKYISALAMAQRAVATQGIERLVAFAGNMFALGWQDALDKVDSRQATDEYARAIGVPPSVVRPDEVVAEIDAQRAQQAQAANAMAMMEQGSRSAQSLGQVKTDENNMMSEMMKE